jgi:hypothetical protein
MKRSQKVIIQALEHIHHAQQPDGSFISLSSTDAHDFSDVYAIPYSTTFFTSNILLCLESAEGHLKPFLTAEARAALDAIKKSAAQFLFEQKNGQWSFNYWDRRAKEFTAIPYPDDLDDTFAALAALINYDRAIIDGATLAAITKLLIATEIQEGGPYKTWLAGKDAGPKWQDVDIAANSTVGYFLSLITVSIPRLERFLRDAVEKDCLLSPYYPGPLHVGYFLSRYYKNGCTETREKLSRSIAAHLHYRSIGLSSGLSPLERAMAISSLVNLGHGEKVPIADATMLLSDAERNGFVPYAFCIDPMRNTERSYAGASALTAAFCIEALARYSTLDALPTETTLSLDKAVFKNNTATHERIRSLARASCVEVGADLRAIALSQIEKVSDKKITSLAYEFQSALQMKRKNISCSIIEQLSLANLYGWMAYGIYDDMLDGEGDPLLIPCANLFLRKLVEIYAALDKDIPGLHDLFNTTMDCIDNANAWELNHCRIAANWHNTLPIALPPFADYKNLADRSIGHAMGPLALLLSIGCAARSKEYQCTVWLFRHYLIARQLHDDAHDWADDLLRGRVNSVGALVLQKFQEKHFNGCDDLAIIKLLPMLKKLFWEEVIDKTTSLIHSHIIAARAAREGSALLGGTGFLESEINCLELSARTAITERNDMLKFLKHYKPHVAYGADAENPLI